MLEKLKNFFGKKKEVIRGVEWDWTNFKSTKGFPISDSLMEWVIGQDKALEECKLCLDEWIYKLKWIKKKKWWQFWKKPELEKPQAQTRGRLLPAGPFLLLLGTQGTGKSLLGRALASHLTKLYKKFGVNLHDIVCWKNKIVPSEPQVSMHPSPEGKELVRKEKAKEAKKSRWKSIGLKLAQIMLIGLGLTLLGITFYQVLVPWILNSNMITMSGVIPTRIFYANNFFEYFMDKVMAFTPLLMAGGSLLFSGIFIVWIGRFLGGNFGAKGIGGAEATSAPKLLVDNSGGIAPFVDATGHSSAQLFGSLAWDPYQRYSKDTFVMTPCGWKLIGEIKEGDEVITLNKETNKVETQKVTWTVKDFVDGKVAHFRNKHFDLIVDQDHAIYDAETKERERAGDYIGRKVSFTRLGDWEGKSSYMSDDFLRFVAWYITEGSSFMDGKHRRIKICQVDNPDNIERIKNILDFLGEKYSYDGKDFRIHHASKGLFEYVQSLGTSALDKKIPPEIKNASKEQLKIFFDEMMLGDGWEHSNNHRQYYTSSFRLRGDIQEVALKLGWGTTVWIDDRKKGWTKNIAYSITFVKGGTFPVKGKLIDYKGNMYCVGVPNGVIFVMRNGKPLWCGNTGGLGTPEHQRVSAGDVHRAHLGILYIDEIKNLVGPEAVTLLTVLEDGQLPVTLRSHFHGGGTAAMAVSTEPIPCMSFLVAAGNLDSVPQIHPALMDRIGGYGKVVYMNDDMPNTVENRRKYVQFISQEINRFNLLPFSRGACIEIIEESRRKCGKRKRLSCIFRPMISIIKTASTLAMNEGMKVVQVKHIKEAIDEHCKTVQEQVLEREIELGSVYRVIDSKAKPKVGQTYGVAVVAMKTKVGTPLPVRASVLKLKKKKKQVGYFHVTGVETKTGSWVQDSILKVRHIFNQMFEIDPQTELRSHIDIAQAIGVEGPSAGITMALALISAYTKVPIKQDVVTTGEINISIDGKVIITPVGSVHEKILAAEKWGFKRICIPRVNYDNDIKLSDYKIKVIPCSKLKDYVRETFEENIFKDEKD